MRMTLAHEDPIDLPMDLKKRVTDDLMHKVFVDYILKSSGKDTKATLKVWFKIYFYFWYNCT